jgi:hypothetical protein
VRKGFDNRYPEIVTHREPLNPSGALNPRWK